MPKQSKKDLEELLKEQISENRALEQRLRDMEARMETMARNYLPRENPPAYTPPSTDSTNALMMETARIIQDSSSVEKTSPFLDKVDEVAWQDFSLRLYITEQKVAKNLQEIYYHLPLCIIMVRK